ncbi:HECT-domain protein [Opisthorchis viverrini]|uniref:HECT-type E3 ubiquitin transferase n=1 Tax=Opisthorchis viverrini TaxID=6198 RepID=A0A1S8WYB8_OPIVI|nr:HECT-domain protein [Opisthorchis viverrini]
MFEKVHPEHTTFIETKRKERDERREARLREQAAICIQRFELLIRHIMSTIETAKPDISFLALALRKATLLDWISVTKWIFVYTLHYLSELDPCTPSGSRLLSLFLSFLLVVTDYSCWSFYDEKLKSSMQQLNAVLLDHMIQYQLYEKLHLLLCKGLARHTPAFTSTSLTGLFTLAVRPLLYSNFNKSKLIIFTSQILTVPGLILHVSSMMNESYDIIVKERLCSKVILLYHNHAEELELLVSSVEGPYVLCFIGQSPNLIQLSLLEEEVIALHCSEFCVVLSKLMRHLSNYVGSKKSNLSSWHPILGWFAQPLDNSLQSAMLFVTKQLRLLWNNRMVRLLFGDLYAQTELDEIAGASSGASSSAKTHSGTAPKSGRSHIELYAGRVRHELTHFFNQLAGGKLGKSKKHSNSLSLYGPHTSLYGPQDLPRSLKAVCMLYCFNVGSLREIKNDILAGLSLGDLLPRLWRLIARCGSVVDWVKILTDSNPVWHLEPHASHLMHIFTAAASNLLSILDDVELFQLNKSFSVDELCSMGTFFNHLVYETVMAVPDPWKLCSGSGTNAKDASTTKAECSPSPLSVTTFPDLFSMCLRLLSIIHERDSRYQFTPANFWLLSNLRISTLLADLRKPKPHALFLLKNVPHIIPHKERVLLFRDRVRDDKASLGVQTRMNWLTDDGPVGAVITVHRNRLVEDGYQQLANLNSSQLRMKIRVQFVNEMGLDEVGIDLDGVFKEFLEETLHRVFDPSLNLFRVTSDQRLYPSPSSHVQDNHLMLFEFLGKMLAKAIYEGIVVDVPFANFFLTQLLGREKAGCYSFLDELATLDKELYKSLSYIKVSGCYTISSFGYSTEISLDEVPIVFLHTFYPISSIFNYRISYVHRVAHFRMYKQIRAQTASFIRGFYSILNPDWLAMFSPPELQKLISGDSISVNIEDLKYHYDGDVADLEFTYSYAEDSLGQMVVHDLCPGGRYITVTNDLKQNTRYSGGFHSNHRVIKWLWDILRRDFSDAERGLFLKFVTSCSRPPLLGFANLEPPFCIRCVQYTNEDQDVGDTLGSVLKGFFGVGGRREEISRLPTTSTCFNLLKLPNYSSRSVLRDKLRYAIHSHAGFELS